MAYIKILLIAASVTLVWGQRPFFAGSRPIGYPEVEKPSTPANELGNRFGEGTTQRLPLEAQGDRDLVDRLSKLPIDKQPFWLINWQALEAHRQQPQSYPVRPNPFAESPINTANSGNINTGSVLGNRNGATDTPVSSSSSASSTVNTPSSTNANTLKTQENELKSSAPNKATETKTSN